MISSTQAVAIAGPHSQFVQHTADAGLSWAVSTTASADLLTSYDQPVLFTDGSVGLPGTSTSADGTSTQVYASPDGGAGFSTTTGPAVSIPNAGGGVPAVTGASSTLLLIPHNGGGAIRVSDDRGRTWLTRAAPTLPDGVLQVSMASSTDGVLITSQSDCANGDKSRCATTLAFYSTSDGGRTWLAR